MKFLDIQHGCLNDYISQNKDNDALWLFHHIPKTAGSSLANELSKNRKEYHNICINYDQNILPYHEKLNLAVENFIKLNHRQLFKSASGHIFPRHIKRIKNALLKKSKEVKLFTFLRSPIERIISEYNYCCSPLHPANQEFIKKYPSIDSYIEDPNERNKMTLYLMGHTNSNESDLAKTIKNDYHFIGLQEKYALSFKVLSSMLWEKSLPSAHERVLNKDGNASTAPLLKSIVKKIEDSNELDMFIFNIVCSQYDLLEKEINDI